MSCSTLVFHGATGQMVDLSNIPAEWRKQFSVPEEALLPSRHFSVDQFPDDVAAALRGFLSGAISMRHLTPRKES